jgi:hypothetical protein
MHGTANQFDTPLLLILLVLLLTATLLCNRPLLLHCKTSQAACDYKSGPAAAALLRMQRLLRYLCC